ncbi:phosphoglucomutase [Anoxybacter fermentans]|uniref:Phosphoglucomutase n=1 Tax=Anoxybacter fermentans TaxID=1323375 RepID=A0A3Q9HRC5_9FIRM|nr:phospho-sugar mutase [Anoxybacter fermentans]AZR73913.1 phosphoglucomutase [Anoxybacter fermentans]
MDYIKKYNEWLNSSYIDEKTKEELLKIKDNEAEIKERFYCDLEFGTGGLRGIIGPGTNRMNKYTVRKATQGLANYIKKLGDEALNRGVAIAYDSRHYSSEFALETASVLNANGIKTYIFDKLTPTPMLSFAVRELNTIAGVVITASHNPPEYNGYKVYWEDGGQIVPDLASLIIEEIKKVTDFSQVKTMSREKAEQMGLFNIIDKSVEDKFIDKIKSLSFIDPGFQDYVANLKIIYTPLHGTGNIPVRRVLAEKGFNNVKVVPEQELPDPDFSTVEYPNPEEKEAFNLAIEMAKKEEADLIIGTDPDCDRIGVVEQTEDGDYVVLTGNQVGVLLTEYILSQRSKKGKLPSNGVIIKTIVTTDMVKEIAEKYGVGVIDTLTGFKFIGEKIKEFEETGEHEFLFGFEESYGYLVGTHARDKDGVVAAAMICEMAAYYKAQGITLYEQLMKLMEEYGYYMEDLVSIKLEGVEGQEKIQKIMEKLRKTTPKEVGSRKVIWLEDYLNQEKYDIPTGKRTALDLPKSNVLKFKFEDKSSFTIRPSGTEPKIKIYFSIIGKSMSHAKELLKELKEEVLEYIGV